MQLLWQYIEGFLKESDANRQALGRALRQTQQSYDVLLGGDPLSAFHGFVDRYNWLGDPGNKATYNITQNLARNLPGALMQDYLIHLVIQRLQGFPRLDVFTEVRVPFGTYPLWETGRVAFETPSQQVDVAVGYRVVEGSPIISQEPWPRPAITQLQPGEVVVPLIEVNSKIRVSQGEFFDWLGRDELLTKGNPNCLSLQVALRAEMDLTIVEAAQATEKFFLLGRGGERNVVGDSAELRRLVRVVDRHLNERMT